MIEQIREDVDPVLVLDHVSKSYEMKDGGHLTAVKDVSLTMKSGECLAIIGESGCGKSTLARLAAHLEPPDSGRIIYQGVPIHRLYKNGFKEYRRQVQLVFQNPASVFSPRMRIGTSDGAVDQLRKEIPKRSGGNGQVFFKKSGVTRGVFL